MNPAFSSGNSNSYDACEFYGRCSSTAVRCSKTIGNMENPRNSRNSCAGSNCSIPDIRSYTCMRGNRIRNRLLRRRLKPERQLVLLEPEPVRLLPVVIKEVFS